ncbi:GNAT family N-acetyltransferase [Chondrinema litorale]|uniref:GNAT family N-acetyltransferase n=1 Tax=Chondrinema litorale TaxID=2994555 RepID=UPI002542832A|nr:GNAT family N-acetyltransferase [Chondrinema litorale]UZR92959.1 GNAT family N-acetyltransferase [Chondrinema litorale]
MSRPLADDVVIRRISDDEPIPFDLLLLADPDKKMIQNYLSDSLVFVAEIETQQIGVFVLYKIDDEKIEIKNIAVKTEYQKKGFGTAMLNYAFTYAKNKGFEKMIISTANSSIQQLKLYQRFGFEITEIKKNFFIDNYSEPIYENGTRAKDLIVHSLRL